MVASTEIEEGAWDGILKEENYESLFDDVSFGPAEVQESLFDNVSFCSDDGEGCCLTI